ncbi:MAG: hypothetical protein OEY52_16560 [Gammaproteobacteria bacterium]|nr:hypothetical protein [Gammaproteobacteria bacterium]
MICIRQHSEDNKLNDINQFLIDIDQYFKVESWIIEIDECLGDNATSIENESRGGKEFSDEIFRSRYKSIYQTIDGSFSIKENGHVVAKLLAVDSSSWDIESSNPNFEKHMLSKYGAY